MPVIAADNNLFCSISSIAHIAHIFLCEKKKKKNQYDVSVLSEHLPAERVTTLTPS